MKAALTITKNLLSIFLLILTGGLILIAQKPNSVLEEKLALAVSQGNLEQIKLLLAQKVSPNARDAFNQPAILLAFRTSQSKDQEKVKAIVEILVEAGVDLNVRNEFGVTPFLA